MKELNLTLPDALEYLMQRGFLEQCGMGTQVDDMAFAFVLFAVNSVFKGHGWSAYLGEQ